MTFASVAGQVEWDGDLTWAAGGKEGAKLAEDDGFVMEVGDGEGTFAGANIGGLGKVISFRDASEGASPLIADDGPPLDIISRRANDHSDLCHVCLDSLGHCSRSWHGGIRIHCSQTPHNRHRRRIVPRQRRRPL